MLQSKSFIKTLKEKPKEADSVSSELLLRAGYIDRLGAGIYSFLPLGYRVLKKIEDIIRNEMNVIGGQEIMMPVLQPKAIWQESGRWDKMDPPLFKLQDRHKKDYALGSTHEEVITDIVRDRVKSYKDLSFVLYQIQAKFRNEMRSTGGLIRTREFIMKDAYSFHTDSKDLKNFYEKMSKVYLNIYKWLGLETVRVEASSGTIGGKVSHEFMIFAESGEDTVVVCDCGFAANQETVESDKCPKCKKTLKKEKAIEVGHIFQLGQSYSKDMNAKYIDKSGKAQNIQMGCYGIGVPRLMAAIVEASHDKNGIIWPESVSPYDIHLINLATDDKEAEKVYKQLKDKNYQVLFDDRTISAGEKLAEFDLIGITKRVVVSDKTIKKNKIELKLRSEKNGRLVEINDV